MKNHIRTGLALSVFLQVLLVKWIGGYPELIETYYSNGLYYYIAKGFRFAFGWIPFSVGDVFYTVAGILAVRFILLHGKIILKRPFFFLREVLVVISLTYFVFHLFWGMNYYRRPLHKTLALSDVYTTETLAGFTEKLIVKANEIHLALTGNDTLPVVTPYGKGDVFKKTPEGFRQLSREFPELAYSPRSIKSSLYSTVLSYMGYSGYLNPFTNEAQINGLMPKFRIPLVSCHEEAHQLGYAAENEANFIGYLAAIYNNDLHFKYSGYLHGLKYCLNALSLEDPQKFKALYPRLNKGIVKNYLQSEQFWRSYQGNTEVIFKNSFDAFLKLNNQSAGIKSYAYIVPLLINFHKNNPL